MFTLDVMRHYLFVKNLIVQTHDDPLLKCLIDSDLYYSYQQLHLVASAPYRPMLIYAMAGFASTIVSNKLHLLAMDTSEDYRGNSRLSEAFIEDAYQVSWLFHKKRIPHEYFQAFVPFAMTRENAMRKLMSEKIQQDFIRKRLRDESEAVKYGKVVKTTKKSRVALAPDDKDMTMIRLLQQTNKKSLMRNFKSVIRAVAISQSYKVLDELLRLCPEKETEVLRAFLIGKDLDDRRLTPVEILRVIQRCG